MPKNDKKTDPVDSAPEKSPEASAAEAPLTKHRLVGGYHHGDVSGVVVGVFGDPACPSAALVRDRQGNQHRVELAKSAGTKFRG